MGTYRCIGHTQSLNQQGTIVWYWYGDAFAQLPPNADPDGDGKHVSFNLRFPGQYYDAESELHYNYFRFYDPQTERYITSDPIRLSSVRN